MESETLPPILCDDNIILYQITSQSFLPYLNDFAATVAEATESARIKINTRFTQSDNPISSLEQKARSDYGELQRLCKIIRRALDNGKVPGRQLEEIKHLSKEMTFDAPKPYYKVTLEVRKKCSCMLLKYVIEKGRSEFSDVNHFLLELQKQIDAKAHYYYHMDFLREFLTRLNADGLVRFESNDFNSLVGTRGYRDTDVEQQTYFVNDSKRTVRGLADFTVSAQITDKGEKFFNDECHNTKDNNNLGKEGNKLREIALLNYYKGKRITREKANSFLKGAQQKSGEKLYQFFSFYTKRANRIGVEETERKAGNKIKFFEKVIGKLKPKEKKKAMEDLQTLKAATINEYSQK